MGGAVQVEWKKFSEKFCVWPLKNFHFKSEKILAQEWKKSCVTAKFFHFRVKKSEKIVKFFCVWPWLNPCISFGTKEKENNSGCCRELAGRTKQQWFLLMACWGHCARINAPGKDIWNLSIMLKLNVGPATDEPWLSNPTLCSSLSSF